MLLGGRIFCFSPKSSAMCEAGQVLKIMLITTILTKSSSVTLWAATMLPFVTYCRMQHLLRLKYIYIYMYACIHVYMYIHVYVRSACAPNISLFSTITIKSLVYNICILSQTYQQIVSKVKVSSDVTCVIFLFVSLSLFQNN